MQTLREINHMVGGWYGTCGDAGTRGLGAGNIRIANDPRDRARQQAANKVIRDSRASHADPAEQQAHNCAELVRVAAQFAMAEGEDPHIVEVGDHTVLALNIDGAPAWNLGQLGRDVKISDPLFGIATTGDRYEAELNRVMREMTRAGKEVNLDQRWIAPSSREYTDSILKAPMEVKPASDL